MENTNNSHEKTKQEHLIMHDQINLVCGQIHNKEPELDALEIKHNKAGGYIVVCDYGQAVVRLAKTRCPAALIRRLLASSPSSKARFYISRPTVSFSGDKLVIARQLHQYRVKADLYRVSLKKASLAVERLVGAGISASEIIEKQAIIDHDAEVGFAKALDLIFGKEGPKP